MHGGQRIAILGCGPGGIALALFLKRAGHFPEIFERFDSPKPLGSGLLIQPSGQLVLDQLGLLTALQQSASPVTGLFGICVNSGKRALDMEYRHLGEGCMALGTHRATLFDLLFDAVHAAEVPIHTGCPILTATELARFDGFDLIVDAMGARSPLASGAITDLSYGAYWATVDYPEGSSVATASLDQRYRRAQQMAGIMPVGISPVTGRPSAALFWSAKHNETAAIEARGIAQWRAEFLELWPEASAFVEQIESFDQLTFARYVHRTGKPNSQGNLYHIGDAWHCTSPQLGQGANMALLDAHAFAAALEMATDKRELRSAYAAMRADHVRLYQALSLTFTPLYQSDGAFRPWLRDVVVHNFARLPGVRNLIAHIVGGSFGNRVPD
ncbi:FAD-dependent oxidoreductase [Sphingorhabdus sp.]|jgi:salicylate hydroxylase|uniref:FAD-dependent oxidoreductase n=1 Tax=Sphingorhabdus sp. TaxID=1902408 RepID=UPI003C768917|nr:FAD-dependent monooxygenase [Sphingomonadales bacterium]